MFQAKISNEEVAELQTAQYDGEIIVVDSEHKVEAACRHLEHHSVIGFDTETRPSFKAGVTNRVALLQLHVPGYCYLFRLCRIKFDRQIIKILENKDILKIGAAVHGDIEALHKLRHFREGGFVDLQTIAPQWGIEEKSLRKLSAIVLGRKISKAQRLSNWEAVFLTQQQQAYAATDAWACSEIYARLCATSKTNNSK